VKRFSGRCLIPSNGSTCSRYGSVIVKSRRSCALLGVPASQFGIARWNCVAVPARPWLAVPRVDHAEGTLWFSLPGGLSATLGK
jgi:hypothetical protein